MMKRVLLLIASIGSLNTWAVPKVKPVYIGSTGTPKEAAPTSDYLTAKGFAFVNTDAAYIGENTGAIDFIVNSSTRGKMNTTGTLQWYGRANFGNTSLPTANISIAAGTAAAGTAPLKFASGTNLTTPESGTIEFDGTELFFTPSQLVRTTVSTVLSKEASTVTVSNNAVEQTLCSFTLPSNLMGLNRQIRFVVQGSLLNSSGGTRNEIFRIRLNGAASSPTVAPTGTVLMTATHTVAANAAARAFVAEFIFASNNSTTAQYMSWSSKMGAGATAAGTTATVFDEQFGTNTGTADTTAGNTIYLSIQHAVANASLSFSIYSVVTEIL